MSKELILSAGYVAIVDDADFDFLNQWKWSTAKRGKKVYAYRMIGPKKQRETVYLHRVILEAYSGIEVDHVNGNGLDNQRSNLRLCTSAQNKYNRGKDHDNRSGHKGVTWKKALGKWHAQIKNNYRTIHLGYFTDIVEAAEAYKRAAAEMHGEFARTE